jgi:hypothetical protein
MACGCGGAQNSKVAYVFTDATGKQRQFRTDIEARAAQIRAGGGGSIREVAAK